MSFIEIIEKLPLLPKIAFSNWIVICIAQFIFFPIIANLIKHRFNNIDIEIRSNPYFSFTNYSKFWKESKEINSKINDSKVFQYLKYRKYFWGYAILSFAFWIVAIFLAVYKSAN